LRVILWRDDARSRVAASRRGVACGHVENVGMEIGHEEELLCGCDGSGWCDRRLRWWTLAHHCKEQESQRSNEVRLHDGECVCEHAVPSSWRLVDDIVQVSMMVPLPV